MNKIIISIPFLFFLMIVVAFMGFALDRVIYQPEATPEIRYVNHIIETPAETEKEIIVQEVPLRPRQFNSVDELKAWLAEDDTDSTIYIFGFGCLDTYDCEDYARALMINALKDGYLVSIQWEDNHALNSTIIGNSVYFIEPQNDDIWFKGYLD
jgi:hypothetical protein